MPPSPIPVRRVPLLCGPPGNGGGVLRQYSMAMASAAARGRGNAGTRGLVRILPRGTSSGYVPMGATPAAGVERQLSGFPYGASAYESGFPFGLVPYGGLEGGPALVMRAGTRRLSGLGAWDETAATANMGKPKQPGEFYPDANKVWTCGNPMQLRACEIGQAGAAGACKKCAGQPAAPVTDNETTLYKTAIGILTPWIAQLSAGQIDPATAPPNAATLGVNKNPANAAVYQQYADLVASISGAALQGQMMWRLTHGGTPSTSSGTTTTLAPSPTATAPAGYVYDPSTGTYKPPPAWNPQTGTYYDPTTGRTLVQAGGQSAMNMPAGVTPEPIGAAAPYGQDPIYGAADSGVPSSYVTAPGFAAPARVGPPKPQAAAKAPLGKGAALGGIAVLALIAWGMSKRKKAS